jgi:hypothetical protein
VGSGSVSDNRLDKYPLTISTPPCRNVTGVGVLAPASYLRENCQLVREESPVPVKKKAKKQPYAAFHGKAKGGMDVVAIQNLHMVLVQEDGAWFAQALEIDYVAQGSSIK